MVGDYSLINPAREDARPPGAQAPVEPPVEGRVLSRPQGRRPRRSVALQVRKQRLDLPWRASVPASRVGWIASGPEINRSKGKGQKSEVSLAVGSESVNQCGFPIVSRYCRTLSSADLRPIVVYVPDPQWSKVVSCKG